MFTLERMQLDPCKHGIAQAQKYVRNCIIGCVFRCAFKGDVFKHDRKDKVGQQGKFRHCCACGTYIQAQVLRPLANGHSPDEVKVDVGATAETQLSKDASVEVNATLASAAAPHVRFPSV